ncbi:MAG TPA: hypothetical protein VH796_12955 [Nitrososphaeraceae archaeon]
MVDEQADRILKGVVFGFDILTEQNELKICDNNEKKDSYYYARRKLKVVSAEPVYYWYQPTYT